MAEKVRRARVPDLEALSEGQAARLAAVADVSADRLVGKSLTDLRPELEWELDPHVLLYRRVCGRVLRKNPATGQDDPVPGATVHVEDTDVNLLMYFPFSGLFGWLYPQFIRRETIGTGTTDACGRFCVWVPRFDIDYVLRWRARLVCSPTIFRRPTLADVATLATTFVEIEPGPRPDPAPDPRALLLRRGTLALTAAETLLGAKVADRLRLADVFASSLGARDVDLDQPAFPSSMPPPLPAPDAGGSAHEAFEPAMQLLPDGIEPDPLTPAEPLRWIGPVLRCHWDVQPVWQTLYDVPDITFRVTQDVDGDGVEETIYSEGLIDVRWDAGPIPPVTLYAAPFARTVPGCGVRPPSGPCDVPLILQVGNMPLENPTEPGTYPIVDTVSGYAVRANRPHASGRAEETPSPATLATAPVAGVLELWGCAQRSSDGTAADVYRVLCSTYHPGTGTWSPPLPVIDSWVQYRMVGGTLDTRLISAGLDGWYPTLDPTDGWTPGERLLVEWDNPPDGLHELTLDVGNNAGGGTNVVETAPPRRLRVDSSRPDVAIVSLAWRPGSSGPLTTLPLDCPTIRRNHQTIEIHVGFQVTARHLRSVDIGLAGCILGGGSGTPTLVRGLEQLHSPTGAPSPHYWHKGPADNSLSFVAVYRIPASYSVGAYTAVVTAFSRAFWPDDGHDYLPAQHDVGYNPGPIYAQRSLAVAMVD